MVDALQSEWFSLDEFACHDGTPVPDDAQVLSSLRRLVHNHLEPLRKEFGPVTIISGYRTSGHNDRVGGARASRHLYDSFPLEVAADIRCATGTPREWFKALERYRPGGLGLYVHHVHVDNRRRHARW